MKAMTLLLTVFLSSCAQFGGDYCDLYTPVNLTRAGAEAVVRADRPAAERIAVNEDLHGECK